MKKYLILSVLLLASSISLASASSNNDCKEVNFDDGATACVSINNVRTNRWELQTDIDDWSTSSLRCDIMLPDSGLRSISSCNGEFSYTKETEGKIKLWIRYNENAPEDRDGKPSSNSQRTYPQWMYDFGEEEWSDNNDYSDISNWDLDNFYLTTDDSSPTTNQRVDLTIEARDDDDDTITDYTDTVNFRVYYRTSSSSSRTPTTSTSYYEIDADYDDWYEFDSSDDGEADLTNFIEFKKSYDYKVRVYDENDSSIYKEITFYVDGSSSSSDGDLDNFYLTTDDSSPTTNQRVDLTIEARDDDDDTITDYTDTVNFRVYYRTSSSSSRTPTTSTSYYEIDTDYDDWYEFDSSDDGEADLTNFIEFKKSYDYKVRVYDENDSSIYKEITFYVDGSSSSSTDWFSSNEMDTVQTMYELRPTMITQLKNQYTKLRNSTTWENMSDDFFDDMEDIIDERSSRTYDTYDDYYDGFTDWYNYTIRIR